MRIFLHGAKVHSTFSPNIPLVGVAMSSRYAGSVGGAISPAPPMPQEKSFALKVIYIVCS